MSSDLTIGVVTLLAVILPVEILPAEIFPVLVNRYAATSTLLYELLKNGSPLAQKYPAALMFELTLMLPAAIFPVLVNRYAATSILPYELLKNGSPLAQKNPAALTLPVVLILPVATIELPALDPTLIFPPMPRPPATTTAPVVDDIESVSELETKLPVNES